MQELPGPLTDAETRRQFKLHRERNGPVVASSNGDSTVLAPVSLKSRLRRFLLSDLPATYAQPINSVPSSPQPNRDLFKEVSTNRRQFFNLPWQRYANPDDLVGKKGLKVYGEMQHDDAVKAALTLKKHAVLSTGWDIEPANADALNVETAEFIKYNFVKMEGSLDDNLLAIMSALSFGFSLSELIFQQFESGAYAGKIGLKAIKTRLPYEFGFMTDPYDNLLEDGITQGSSRYPTSKFVLYSFNSEFGNLYGTSDLRAAYAPYWMKKNVWNWWAMFLDRYGIPLAEGMYPRNSGLSDQAVSDLQTSLDRLQAATSITHPDDIKLAFPTSSISAQGSQVFEKALQAAELAIARALLLPNLLGISAQGDTGSFGQAKKHFDVFILIVQKLQRELSENVMGEQIIRRVVDLNYKVEEYPKFVFLPFTETNKADLLELWLTAVEKAAVKSRPEDEAHIRMMTEFPEIPLEDLQAEENQAKATTGASSESVVFSSGGSHEGWSMSDEEMLAMIDQLRDHLDSTHV